jgi:alkanesulfonate monooxygenase SsuD/methylene tetrahydromethanopterin reductase-like flavin-dependent oxidoreductase (luciferase family)
MTVTPSWTTHPWVAQGSGMVRFGIALPYGVGDWVRQRDLVQAADDLGFDSIWATDHPALGVDSWTTLAAYAVSTHHLRLGSLVNCIYYRNPVILVRQAIDVDRLSNGRAVLGLGAGWLASEFAFLGIPFAPIGQRLRRLAETAREFHRLFEAPPVFIMRASPDEARVAGFAGLSIQQPRIPLLIGGAGEKTLSLVAAYADMCSLEWAKAPTPQDIRKKLAVMDGSLEKHGRGAESVIRSHYLLVAALADTAGHLAEKVQLLPEYFRNHAFIKSFTARDLVAYYRPIVAAGANYLIYSPAVGLDLNDLRVLAEKVMPEVQGDVAS